MELLKSNFLAGHSSNIDLLTLDAADDAADAANSSSSTKEKETNSKPPLVRTESEAERASLLSWLKKESTQLGAARGALDAMKRSGKEADIVIRFVCFFIFNIVWFYGFFF